MSTTASRRASVLHQRVFVRLLAGNFVLFLGVWLYVAAAAWVMLELTRSALMVGIVGGATFLPRVLLALPAGAVIDIFERRLMMIAGNLFQSAIAFIVGILTASGRLGPWALVVLTLCLGIGQALAMPAYQTVIQDVVPRELVATALSLGSGSVNVARAIGPAIGGALIATGRTEIAFMITGVCLLAPCAAALSIPKPARAGHRPEPIGQAMLRGLRYVTHTPLIVRAILAMSLYSATSINLQTLLAPASVARGLSAQGYGLLFSCYGIGALAGALGNGRLTKVARSRTYELAIALFSLCGLGFAYVPGVWPAAILITLAGAAWVVTNASFNTLVQLSTPARVRGRVISLYMMGLTCALPLGSVTSGALASAIGVAHAIGLMSLAVAVVAVVTSRLKFPASTDVQRVEHR